MSQTAARRTGPARSPRPVDPQAVAAAEGLRPLVTPLRRGAGEVQFGTAPGSGVVLAGLTEAESAWLLSLRPGRSSRPPGAGVAWGLDPVRVTALADLLRAHGLADVDRSPSAREGRSVAVLGRGPLHDQLCGQVRRAGVPLVTPALDPEDPPDLAVLLAAEAVAPHEARSWAASGVPHLPLVVSGHRAVVGPLVGRSGAPCLHCLDLSRRDLDPAWPWLLSQLLASDRQAQAGLSVDPALATTVAGLVGILVQGHLDGIPVPAGVTWEVALPSPTVTARRWSRHPRCPCAQETGQAATSFLRGRPLGRLRATTTPESTS
jgi:hypothetical protein